MSVTSNLPLLYFLFICSIFPAFYLQATSVCHPSQSRPDFNMETFGGGFCHFPFYHGNSLQNECVWKDNHLYFCPTNCNGTSFKRCKWLHFHITRPGCSQLMNSTRDKDLDTLDFTNRCVFPFYYQGKCYSDCSTVNNNGQLWCSHNPVFVFSENNGSKITQKYADCLYKKSWISDTSSLKRGYYQIIPICNNTVFCNKTLTISRRIQRRGKLVPFLPVTEMLGMMTTFKVQPIHNDQLMILIPKSCSQNGKQAIINAKNGFNLLVNSPYHSSEATTIYYKKVGKNTFHIGHNELLLNNIKYLRPGLTEYGNISFTYGQVESSDSQIKWIFKAVVMSEKEFHSQGCDVIYTPIQSTEEPKPLQATTISMVIPHKEMNPSLILILSVLSAVVLLTGLIAVGFYKSYFVNAFNW